MQLIVMLARKGNEKHEDGMRGVNTYISLHCGSVTKRFVLMAIINWEDECSKRDL
jgi:hypothetical protein